MSSHIPGSHIPFYLRYNPFARPEEQKGAPASEQKGAAVPNQGTEQKGASRVNEVAARTIANRVPPAPVSGTHSLNGAIPRYVAPIQPAPQIGNPFASSGQRPAIRPPITGVPRAPVGYEPKKT